MAETGEDDGRVEADIAETDEGECAGLNGN